jgi:adenine-specific DNA-methyltransferase
LERQAQLAQFFTPPAIAQFMASLFTLGVNSSCVLLDAGAGRGSLSQAFLDQWVSGDLPFTSVRLDAFEIDEALCISLGQTLAKYKGLPGFIACIHNTDFINAAADSLSSPILARNTVLYTHAILNPPYRKIDRNSHYRGTIRRVGIETVNLYSAFVALSLSLLAEHGQLVAIIPRSFCNGPYYRPFRDFVFKHAALRRMHLFKSRTTAFKNDDVLQENIIVMLERGCDQGHVTVSSSTDHSFSDLTTHQFAFDQIVLPGDPERIIHVPTSSGQNPLELLPRTSYSLEQLGIEVSTGPVVDFRVREYLRDIPEPHSVPLLYPSHFSRSTTIWPRPEGKKPNAILFNTETRKWLYPNGYYCVVRRLSSKEEKRRIVASVVEPSAFPNAQMIGFENHLNVLHEHKHGLPEELARGLAMYLNTTAVDEYFRCFNGHTQVNATDLRLIKFPSRDVLIQLGEWARQQRELTQTLIDDAYGALSK